MCSSWQDFVPFATKKIQVFTAKKLYLAQVTFGIYELGSAMRGTLINNIFFQLEVHRGPTWAS
jgi:hypothetical protein